MLSENTKGIYGDLNDAFRLSELLEENVFAVLSIGNVMQD